MFAETEKEWLEYSTIKVNMNVVLPLVVYVVCVYVVVHYRVAWCTVSHYWQVSPETIAAGGESLLHPIFKRRQNRGTRDLRTLGPPESQT